MTNIVPLSEIMNLIQLMGYGFIQENFLVMFNKKQCHSCKDITQDVRKYVCDFCFAIPDGMTFPIRGFSMSMPDEGSNYGIEWQQNVFVVGVDNFTVISFSSNEVSFITKND